MKLICCPKCRDLVKLSTAVRKCECGECGGKYVADGFTTAVVNKTAIVVGIDNNTYIDAVKKYFMGLEKYPGIRIDFFFTGWIPTLPGEVVVLNSIDEIEGYVPNSSEMSTISTMPVSQE